MNRPQAAIVPTLIALAVAGCGGSGSGGGGPATVLKPGEAIGMKTLRFHPDHAQVAVGQEITWHNEDGVPHNVVAHKGATFESKTFGHDGTFSYTPTTAGTIAYECTLHPGMKGTVDVVAK